MNGTVHIRLHQAIVDNNLMEVESLLAPGDIDVNVVGEDEKGALHVAAEIGNLEVVRVLLAYNPTVGNLRGVDINAADIIGSTALHYAVEKGHEPVVRVLLDRAEINPNAIAEHNDSKTPMHIAAEKGNLEVVRMLLAYNPTVENLRGVDVNAADIIGSTALHYAVEKGHEPVVGVLLDRAEINPNAIAERNDSKTPLHIAAEKGKWEIVHALLSSRHTIQVNARDRWGSTALHIAAVGENERVVEELLSYCKLHNLDNAPKNQRRASPLHLAAFYGRHKIVSKLITAGLPVNKTALSRHTPLHFAVHSGSWQTVRVLLKEGEDLKVSEADWRGLTPVDYARLACKTNRNGFRSQTLPQQESPREDAQIMMQMLEGFDLEGLRNDRRSYIDSANAILVGAALIASIAFTSWLQPPLGFQVDQNSSVANVYFYGAAMKAFWIFNSLSFFCAISSFVTGADAALPQRFGRQVEAVTNVRIDVIRASKFLFVAVVCIIVAFICAGFADLPLFHNNSWYMIVPGVVGGLLCVYVLGRYFLKIRDAQDSNSNSMATGLNSIKLI